MCPDRAFTLGVLVLRSWVTSGRSGQGHTARSAPTSKSHSTPGSGASTQGLAACGQAK